MVIDTISFGEAQARQLVRIGKGAMVSHLASFIPTEDDGRSSGMTVIGEDALVRAGAIICSGAYIGDGSIIGHQCVIRARVRIGSNSLLSHLVCLESDSVVGDRVRISALTHITSGCQIDDDVQIGARVVTINDNEMRWRAGEILQAPRIMRGANIGSGTTLLGHVTIGENAFIGAGSVVTRSIPASALAYGNPAYVRGNRPRGAWLAGASRLPDETK